MVDYLFLAKVCETLLKAEKSKPYWKIGIHGVFTGSGFQGTRPLASRQLGVRRVYYLGCDSFVDFPCIGI